MKAANQCQEPKIKKRRLNKSPKPVEKQDIDNPFCTPMKPGKNTVVKQQIKKEKTPNKQENKITNYFALKGSQKRDSKELEDNSALYNRIYKHMYQSENEDGSEVDQKKLDLEKSSQRFDTSALQNTEANTLEHIQKKQLHDRIIQLRRNKLEKRLKNNAEKWIAQNFKKIREYEKEKRDKFTSIAGHIEQQWKSLYFVQSNELKNTKCQLDQCEKVFKLMEITAKNTKQYTDLKVKVEKLKEKHLQLCIQKETLIRNKKMIQSQKECWLERQNWPVLNGYLYPFYLIGRGGFSQVYRCFDMKRKQQVALKLSFKHFSHPEDNEQYRKFITREFDNQRLLHHQNIVKVYDKVEFESDKVFAYTLELLQGPELSQYVSARKGLQQFEAKKIIRQLLEGLLYMKSNGIIHYDLKPNNIVFHNGLVKIVDFSVSKQLEIGQQEMEMTNAWVGSFFYLPPEARQGSTISAKVDIFSLGIIFYELIYNTRPFGNKLTPNQTANIIRNVQTFKITFPSQSTHPFSQQGKEFILKCLQYSAEKRYSAEEALKSEYMMRQE